MTDKGILCLMATHIFAAQVSRGNCVVDADRERHAKQAADDAVSIAAHIEKYRQAGAQARAAESEPA